MKVRPPRVSLVWMLALAYLGLALLAAVTVRIVSLSMELHELDEDLSRGLLSRAAAEAAVQMGAELPGEANPPPAVVHRELVLAHDTVETVLSDAGHKGVLTELGNPVRVTWTAPDGRVLGQRGRGAAPGVARTWRRTATLADRHGRTAGSLTVELTRGAPGARALMGDGLEWPALVIYAVVFGLGSALVLQFAVTRRLGAIARTADAWSAGDFSHSVSDSAPDEIGQLSQRLDQMARELEILVAMRAEFAGVSERQRMARELHDTVKQKAFALQLQLAVLSRSAGLDAQTAQTLEDARGITREIQEELAYLIGETKPTSTEPFDQVLDERAQAWGRRGRFGVRADLAAAREVPAKQRPIVMRVLDEALANVMRHSGAEQAVVSLRSLGERLELRIEDDGRGFDRVSEGMGLRNMRQRASELPDGSLILEAGAAGGARVTLNWAKARTETS